LIKCSVCGAEVARGIPFCPICGAALGFSFRPVIAGLIHLALCALALYFIPKPYAYIAAAPFALLALLSLGAGGLGLYRSLKG
jgi:zinc-ribbon domain